MSVLGQPAVERLGHRPQFAAQLTLGQIRHRLRRRGVLDQRRHHRPARHPEDRTGHAGELDIGALQHLDRAVLLARQILGHEPAQPDQIAQFTDRRRWHEARLDQAVADQIGDPLGILDVGLAPRHRLDVMGVGDDQFEVTLQHRMDRLQ